MVAHEHELLGAEHRGDEALGLRRLRRLVDEHLHASACRVVGEACSLVARGCSLVGWRRAAAGWHKAAAWFRRAAAGWRGAAARGCGTWRKRMALMQGSPAVEHVQQTTSAACRISRSVARLSWLYFFSSAC